MRNRTWQDLGRDQYGNSVSIAGPLRAIVSQDEGRWHLSVSRADRYPSWDEIADTRYDLLPQDIEVALILPPPAHYINHHPYTFHLWEINDPDLPIERFPTGMMRTRETILGTPGAERSLL